MINFSLSPGVEFNADHADDRLVLIDRRIGYKNFPPIRRLDGIRHNLFPGQRCPQILLNLRFDQIAGIPEILAVRIQAI